VKRHRRATLRNSLSRPAAHGWPPLTWSPADKISIGKKRLGYKERINAQPDSATR
jgi:hypothetical protein